MRWPQASPGNFAGIGIAFAVFVLFLTLVALWMLFGERQSTSTPIADVIHDREFWQTLGRTLTFALIAIALKTVFAWVLIPFLYKSGDRLLPSFLLVPWVVPTSVATLAWLWFFYDIGGGANLLLMRVASPGMNWLGNPHRAFAIVIVLNVWREHLSGHLL